MTNNTQFNIDKIVKWKDKLEDSVSNCRSDSLPQAIEVATHIERAFYEKEIDEKGRTDWHKTLDELVKEFFVRCECNKEIPMTFD